MKLLTKNDILVANYRTVKAHGGNYVPPYNFLHEANLDYIIDIIDEKIFGEPCYPTVAAKASLYFYNIICNHIFSDGNKRTGLEAAIMFLGENGYQLRRDMANIEIFDFVTAVASGQKTLEECLTWFDNHIEPI